MNASEDPIEVPSEDPVVPAEDPIEVQPEELTEVAQVASADAPPGEPALVVPEEPLSKRKIEEQLEALKRKEAELRRALVVADHPELADGIRLLQGRTYALERSEEKLAAGLTKAELRRRETLQKKRAGLEEKRAELDAQIAELDGELKGLGVERQQGFEAEHRQALEELMIALSAHLGEVQSAGLELTDLIPDIKRWLPEIERIAAQKTAN